MASNCTYDHERILKLWEKGLSTRVIAERIGCNIRTVRTVIKNAGKGRCGK